MEDKEKQQQQQHKKQKHQHPTPINSTAKPTPKPKPKPPPPSPADFAFRPTPEVKGLRFGGQFIVKSFTIRRARPLELLKVLSFPPTYRKTSDGGTGNNSNNGSRLLPFPSTTAYVPTDFTILAHHAWHTLTLGLGTRKSKVVVFVFESEGLKSAVDRSWPSEIALGDVNRRLIRGLTGYEMARFKFRKGCITFYVYAVRRTGALGFSRGDDLRVILESVVELKDFLDHTAMLAMPNQRSISFSNNNINTSRPTVATAMAP
ncbi:hypothetical protein MLD38_024156 [Melastoma candidum]|uniref:Uncharacterized protein n=1 Tax=Melastoma candidum TaxID=119954 RepID=A0ACB9NRJ3_9MYRT|nr:hypothetical protein MLD38_024156 [Melastoma candidum]